MYELLIKNGLVYMEGEFLPVNICSAGGKIAAHFPHGCEPEAARVIDARGRHVFPGFIDPHCHLRDPGLTHKEETSERRQWSGKHRECIKDHFAVLEDVMQT